MYGPSGFFGSGHQYGPSLKYSLAGRFSPSGRAKVTLHGPALSAFAATARICSASVCLSRIAVASALERSTRFLRSCARNASAGRKRNPRRRMSTLYSLRYRSARFGELADQRVRPCNVHAKDRSGNAQGRNHSIVGSVNRRPDAAPFDLVFLVVDREALLANAADLRD